jgi:DNA polymerase-4
MAQGRPLVAHLDLDAFYAAVELLDHPELRGRPLVVGGDPHGRGVVATASYEARRHGIRSAMSAAEALRRCPDAVFVRPDFDRYRERSREVWSIVGALIERVEQVGIDEGYLDLSAAHGNAAVAHEALEALQRAVRDQTGLDCSLGCGTSKTVAKIASDHDKPRGLVVVPPGGERSFLDPLALRLLPGIGPRTEARLAQLGLRTIGDLARLTDEGLSGPLGGKVGRELRDRARGDDPRPVVTESAAPVTIGHEETFERDLVTLEQLDAWLDRLSRSVWGRIERRGLRARTASTKLRYADFTIVTRSQTLRDPIESEEELVELSQALLRRALEERADPIRLLGVYVAGLEDGNAPGQLRLPLRIP